MHIGDKTKLIATIAEDYGLTLNWSIEQLNKVYAIVNYDILRKKYGFLNDGHGAETDIKISDALKFLKTKATIALTLGSGNIPNDYYHNLKLKVLAGGSGVVVGQGIDVITEEEDMEREDSSITMATYRNPTALLYGTTMDIKPTTITSISAVYYRKPVTPVYTVTETNGIMVYSAGSTQFEWDENHDIDIIRYTLEYAGLSMRNDQILPYVQNKKIEES